MRLTALTASADAAGIWTIQSGIFPENMASLRLHQRAGFRVVGTRERIGRHHGRWRDVLLIERRSGKLTPPRPRAQASVPLTSAPAHFCTRLFGVEPAERRPGYANLAITEPSLKLVLIEGTPGEATRMPTPVATVAEGCQRA